MNFSLSIFHTGIEKLILLKSVPEAFTLGRSFMLFAIIQSLILLSSTLHEPGFGYVPQLLVELVPYQPGTSTGRCSYI